MCLYTRYAALCCTCTHMEKPRHLPTHVRHRHHMKISQNCLMFPDNMYTRKALSCDTSHELSTKNLPKISCICTCESCLRRHHVYARETIPPFSRNCHVYAHVYAHVSAHLSMRVHSMCVYICIHTSVCMYAPCVCACLHPCATHVYTHVLRCMSTHMYAPWTH